MKLFEKLFRWSCLMKLFRWCYIWLSCSGDAILVGLFQWSCSGGAVLFKLFWWCCFSALFQYMENTQLATIRCRHGWPEVRGTQEIGRSVDISQTHLDAVLHTGVFLMNTAFPLLTFTHCSDFTQDNGSIRDWFSRKCSVITSRFQDFLFGNSKFKPLTSRKSWHS